MRYAKALLKLRHSWNYHLLPPVNLCRKFLDVDVVGALRTASVAGRHDVGVAVQVVLGEVLL